MSASGFSSINKASRFLGGSSAASYIIGYVKALGCQSIYVEAEYRDRDFMIDYQRFYSRSFSSIPNTVTRVHFFDGTVDMDHLLSPDVPDEEINDGYIGFAVVKPIMEGGEPLIGRTVLRHPRSDSATVYLGRDQHMSLMGRDLHIRTMPFTSQDLAVGKCATAALWMSMTMISESSHVMRRSMYEITEEANRRSDSESRSFPSGGLMLSQMCGFLHGAGLELDVLQMEHIDETIRRDYLNVFIGPLLSGGIPIVLGITMRSKGCMEPRNDHDGPDYDHHAVVLSGCTRDASGKVSGLFVHDDQIGPYANLVSDDGFRTVRYDEHALWSEKYDEIYVDFALVPFDPKVRASLTAVWGMVIALQDNGLNARFGFMLGTEYKRSLRQRSLRDRSSLEVQLPRYVWVATADNGTDVVLDATSPDLTPVLEVVYDPRCRNHRHHRSADS